MEQSHQFFHSDPVSAPSPRHERLFALAKQRGDRKKPAFGMMRSVEVELSDQDLHDIQARAIGSFARP